MYSTALPPRPLADFDTTPYSVGKHYALPSTNSFSTSFFITSPLPVAAKMATKSQITSNRLRSQTISLQVSSQGASSQILRNNLLLLHHFNLPPQVNKMKPVASTFPIPCPSPQPHAHRSFLLGNPWRPVVNWAYLFMTICRPLQGRLVLGNPACLVVIPLPSSRSL